MEWVTYIRTYRYINTIYIYIYIMPWKMENIVNVNGLIDHLRLQETWMHYSQKKKGKIGLLQENWFLDWSYVLGMYRHLSFVPQINSIILIYNGTLRDLSGSAYYIYVGLLTLHVCRCTTKDWEVFKGNDSRWHPSFAI